MKSNKNNNNNKDTNNKKSNNTYRTNNNNKSRNQDYEPTSLCEVVDCECCPEQGRCDGCW